MPFQVKNKISLVGRSIVPFLDMTPCGSQSSTPTKPFRSASAPPEVQPDLHHCTKVQPLLQLGIEHFALALCCHSIATRAPIANLPNSAQLRGIPYHSPKLHPGLCNSVGMWLQTQTDRQTDAHDHNTFRIVYDSREM